MLASLRNIAITLASALQTRLELFGNELHSQKLSVARQLGFGLACLFCIGLSVALAVALAVAIWWEHRVWVLGISCALSVLGSVWLFVVLRQSLMVKESMFAASLEALKDDLALLKSATELGGAARGATPANE